VFPTGLLTAPYNTRVSGPGHFYMTQLEPRYHRDGKPMHEIGKNSVHAQAMGGKPGSTKVFSCERRLDYAARFWALDRNGGIWNSTMSEQQYQEEIQQPHCWWQIYYTKPCFGLD
jgi:hypothetical protein